MNLNKLNVVELNHQEMREVQGGILPWIVVGVIIFLASTEEAY